jgi:hypothetical protein
MDTVPSIMKSHLQDSRLPTLALGLHAVGG